MEWVRHLSASSFFMYCVPSLILKSHVFFLTLCEVAGHVVHEIVVAMRKGRVSLCVRGSCHFV